MRLHAASKINSPLCLIPPSSVPSVKVLVTHLLLPLTSPTCFGLVSFLHGPLHPATRYLVSARSESLSPLCPTFRFFNPNTGLEILRFRLRVQMQSGKARPSPPHHEGKAFVVKYFTWSFPPKFMSSSLPSHSCPIHTLLTILQVCSFSKISIARHPLFSHSAKPLYGFHTKQGKRDKTLIL
jgi:hypothetical protein